MGLVKAAMNAASGVMADQWKEFFYCDALPAEVLAVKGQKRTDRRSANKHGNENIISDGSVVAVAVLVVLVKAYGGGVFGTEMFPAAQAAAVASVVGGIANVPVFIGGLVASVIVYFITVITMLGLGIYLPGYLTLTAVLGGVIRFILDKAAPKFSNARGGIIAAGLLAGEGFLGVIIALGTAISIIKGM